MLYFSQQKIWLLSGEKICFPDVPSGRKSAEQEGIAQPWHTPPSPPVSTAQGGAAQEYPGAVVWVRASSETGSGRALGRI